MTIYLGENIKKLRREKGLTQENLAEFLGVTFQSVSNWERGESYPDITMLPEIAGFFKVSVDEILGLNKADAEKKINEYLEIYDKQRYKDTPATFRTLQKAVKDFPSDFRLLVRYMELLMCEISPEDTAEYEKASREILSIYENIQNNCTDDSIRMWAKRLICQHLHTKAHYTGNDIYQLQAEQILSEMPDILNTKNYLSTMLITDKNKHYAACSDAIENMLFLLEHSVNHLCLYEEDFSAEYKTEALNKMLAVYDIFYTDGNYGKSWLDVIYNHGHLGLFYAESGDTKKALVHLKAAAEYAVKYDNLPDISERKAQFFESRNYVKTARGKTMCQRMKYLFTEKYEFSDEFRSSAEFKEVLALLGDN